jgi:hypothetical protein
MSKRKWQVNILGNGNVLSPSFFCQKQLNVHFAHNLCKHNLLVNMQTNKQNKANKSLLKRSLKSDMMSTKQKLVMMMMEYGTKFSKEGSRTNMRLEI